MKNTTLAARLKPRPFKADSNCTALHRLR